MKRTEVDIFYNEKKGYIFASKTIYLGRVTHGTINPVLRLPIDKASDELIGEYFRRALDISRQAEPIDLDKVGIYEYWTESGEKRFSSFSKKYAFIKIDELDDGLFYRKFVHVNRGGYILSSKDDESGLLSNSLSNEELGAFVRRMTN